MHHKYFEFIRLQCTVAGGVSVTSVEKLEIWGSLVLSETSSSSLQWPSAHRVFGERSSADGSCFQLSSRFGLGSKQVICLHLFNILFWGGELHRCS